MRTARKALRPRLRALPERFQSLTAGQKARRERLRGSAARLGGLGPRRKASRPALGASVGRLGAPASQLAGRRVTPRDRLLPLARPGDGTRCNEPLNFLPFTLSETRRDPLQRTVELLPSLPPKGLRRWRRGKTPPGLRLRAHLRFRLLRRRARFKPSLHVMSERTVFISYRRDATGKLFALARRGPKHHGYDVFLDVDCIDAGEWAKQILTEVPKRAHFLLLLTPGALDRCADKNDWVRREFLLALERRRNIVPVREESVDPVTMRAAAPEAVKAIFDLQIHTIQHRTFEGDVETLTTRYIPPDKAPKEGISKSPTFQADISRIIKHAPAELIGREAETKLLTDVLDQAMRGEPKRPHVLTFVALGGEGEDLAGGEVGGGFGVSKMAGVRHRLRVVLL